VVVKLVWVVKKINNTSQSKYPPLLGAAVASTDAAGWGPGVADVASPLYPMPPAGLSIMKRKVQRTYR
jgi:hypothetical protein